MRLGLFTLHYPYNFGANLQCFATQKRLEMLGHQVTVINYVPQNRFGGNYRKIVPEIQWSGHDQFIRENLHLSNWVKSKEELLDLVIKEKFEAIIVGADAIWSYPKTNEDIPPYFMDWLFSNEKPNNIPVASLSAAHMGHGFKHLPQNIRLRLKETLNSYAYISVRDSWTQKVISEHLEIDIKKLVINPDPVFTINNFLNENSKKGNFEFTTENYFIITYPSTKHRGLEKWHKKFKELSNAKGYKVIELPLPEGPSGFLFDYTVEYPIGPIQWYYWIKNSRGFIGLRFHSIVSCIASKTPFLSIDNYGKSNLWIRIINKIGFYKLGRRFDSKSKIKNLLDNTSFTDSRFHGINGFLGFKPNLALNQLVNFDRDKLSNLSSELQSTFDENLSNLIDSIAKN